MTTYRTSVTVLAQIAVQSYANSNIYKANNPLSVGSPRNPLTTAQNLFGHFLNGPQNRIIPAGFEFVAERYEAETNYYGIAIRNKTTNEIVISHRGTEGSAKDIAMDYDIAKGITPGSAGEALAFASDVNRLNPTATIINVGHSKGAYEAAYASAKLVDLAVGMSQDTSRFVFLGLDTPAMNTGESGVGLLRPASSYFGLNIASTTDPVNQLTRAYGLQVLGQSAYVIVDGTGAVSNPASLGPTCSATARSIAPNFDGIGSFAGGGIAYGVNILVNGDNTNTSMGRLFAACNLDFRGHSSVLLSGALDKKIHNMSLSAAIDDPSLRGNAINTAIGALGWGAPEFQVLAQRMIQVYIGKGYGFGSGEGQIDEQAIANSVADLTATHDLAGATAFDLNGTVYIKLASNEVLWVTPDGGRGNERVTQHDDGSVSMETRYPNGTIRLASIDTDGLYEATTSNASGQLLGRISVLADGASTIQLNDPVTGEQYSMQATQVGSNQTATMTGTNQQGQTIQSNVSRQIDAETGLILTTSQNIDGSITTQLTTAEGYMWAESRLFTYDDGTSIRTISRADGRAEAITYDQTQAVSGTRVSETNSDGSVTTQSFSGQYALVSTTKLQNFDDDSSLQTITYPNGRIETLATDTTGTPASLRITIPAGNNTETVDAYTFDASGQRIFQSSTTTETFYDENGTSRIETVTIPFGGSLVTTRQVYDTDGNLVSSEPVITGSQANANITDQQVTTTLNDISSLISAIQGGKPLPILNSGLHLVNTLANPGGVINYPGLNLGTGILGGLASLYSLSNALQNGDTLTKINATLSSLNYVNSTLPALLGSGPLNSSLNGFLNGTGTVYNAAADGLVSSGNFNGLINGGAPGALPVLGLIISIKNHDPIGTVSGLIGILNPTLLTGPVGWILAGASILKVLLANDPPDAWGHAKIIFNANGQISIDTVGEAFGPERVRSLLQNTLDALNQEIATTRTLNPGALIGIVPQRMPSITWREARQADQGYAVLDINPVTAEQRYPYLRFDDNGVPFSSNPAVWQPDPRDPGIRVRFDQQLTQSALRRQAIAPQWEVDTARIQQDVGDPNAGLTEQERAAKLGLGAAYDKTTGQPVGQFRPITLDLDAPGSAGAGTITTAAKDAASNNVAFDWDSSGFYKQVAWVQPNDGFLFVDRNLNGVVTVTAQTLKATESTTYLVAAPAIFYWAGGLKGIKKGAENDDFWLAAA
jgi:hypothetical protein